MKRISLALILGVLVLGSYAVAKTPHGETPSEETVCDELRGRAFGLCNAYCEAMDCDSDTPNASQKACDRVLARFIKKTDGDEPPCLTPPDECPCDYSTERWASPNQTTCPWVDDSCTSRRCEFFPDDYIALSGIKDVTNNAGNRVRCISSLDVDVFSSSCSAFVRCHVDPGSLGTNHITLYFQEETGLNQSQLDSCYEKVRALSEEIALECVEED